MVTTPGLHQNVDITRYPEAIRASVRCIAAQFYVTRSFSCVNIGNSKYYAVLARPSDEFSVYINTDREIVILFSEYDSFEIRTLEAYAVFYEQLESARIDRSLRFLVSSDDRIEAIIRHYLDQNPEYPIIIPVTLNHLVHGGKHSLLEAVRRNYLLRDLFGYQNPLREETFFFGRQLIVNSVLDLSKSGQNSSLFGLRKSGKTSTIYAIQRKARGMSCDVTVIDCQNPAVHARRYDALLSYIIMEIRKNLGQKKIAPNLGETPPEISEKFFLHLNNTLGAAKNSVLLIFDEIENISPRTAASVHWKDGSDTVLFWQIIRSYIQSEAKGRLSLCIVGTSPRILEIPAINDVANPVYLFAQKQFIPNLTFQETSEMVERLGYFMGLHFSPQVVADLQKEFGGHPFFTRQVCSKIHQLASTSRPQDVSQAALKRAIKEFEGQLEEYLRDIIEQLEKDYPEEFALLSNVLRGNDELTEFGREAPELVDHLIGYGLIERTNDDFDIGIAAIRRVLLSLTRTEGVEERWAEVSRRRNALEKCLRVAIFHWTKSLTTIQWANIIEASLTKARREALRTIEPLILFSSKDSPLYLSDLLMLIKNPEVLTYLGDRRSAIVANIDTINKYRGDAHAIVISESEMKSLRGAFDYLECEFAEL
jgi:hypothetical protein